MEDTHAHHDSSFWVGLFLGGILGALLVLLLGTEKGRKLVEKLQDEGFEFLEDKADELSDKTADVEKRVVKGVRKLEQKAEDLIEEGKDLVAEGKVLQEEVVEDIVEKKDEVSNEVVAKADAALAHIEALQERGRQSTQDLRKRLFKNIPRKS